MLLTAVKSVSFGIFTFPPKKSHWGKCINTINTMFCMSVFDWGGLGYRMILSGVRDQKEDFPMSVTGSHGTILCPYLFHQGGLVHVDQSGILCDCEM